jgi:AhpD family alkylhydroperoxidase
MFDAREDLKELQAGLERLKELMPGPVKGTMSAMEVIESPGILDRKTKLLMCISVIAYHRCKDCVVLHVQRALEAGATREEILEAASIAMAFGAGPSMGFTATHILPAIDQFEKGTA